MSTSEQVSSEVTNMRITQQFLPTAFTSRTYFCRICNMRQFAFIGLLIFVCSAALFGFYQNPQIDRKQLREMLSQLGYEVKDIVKDAGKEKYSVTATKYSLDIPVGFEISPSNSYVWLTVNLGAAPEASSPKCSALLKQNAKSQPTFFYITESGRLMAALPIDNQGITNAILRTKFEAISEQVGKSKDVWQ